MRFLSDQMGKITQNSFVEMVVVIFSMSACTTDEKYKGESHEYEECRRIGGLRTVGRVRGLCRRSESRREPGRRRAGDQAENAFRESQERVDGSYADVADRPQGIVYGTEIKTPTGKLYLRSKRSVPIWCENDEIRIALDWIDDKETRWQLFRAQRDLTQIERVECSQ